MRQGLVRVLFLLWLTVPVTDGLNFVVGRYTHVPAALWLVGVGVWNLGVGLWFYRRKDLRRETL